MSWHWVFGVHGRRARRVSKWLGMYGSDKVSVHNYGSFYDDLFERLKPQALLEIGVYRGASLRAWQSAGVASVIGVDNDPAASSTMLGLHGLHVLLATMPQQAYAVADRVGLLDLIIDDGSHIYQDYCVEGAGMKTSELNKGEQRMLQMIAGAMQLCAPEKCDQEFEDAGLEAFLHDVLNRIQLTRNALKTAIAMLEGAKQ